MILRRRDPRPALALALLAVAVVSLLGQIALTWHGYAFERSQSRVFYYVASAGFLVYALVGAGILVRRPGNAVGWIVGAVGLFPLVGALAEEYAARALLSPGTGEPLLHQAQWVSAWYYYAVLGSLPLLFLLFPDGQPASRGARHLVRLAVLTQVVLLGTGMLLPSDDPALPNPYASTVPRTVELVLSAFLVTCLLTSLAGGLASLALRYRRARGVERPQVTCLLYTATLGVSLFFLDPVLPGDVALATSFVLPALGVGAAVLRYRLYDIDRLVSRTVSYVLLSALLALPYVLVVAGASRLGGGNQAAVALATLAAAAAFQPLRRTVQDRVDRRFNRSRYDAARTVQAYSDRLRQEVDLDTVRADLLDVVRSTVQPTCATVWLRVPQRRDQPS